MPTEFHYLCDVARAHKYKGSKRQHEIHEAEHRIAKRDVFLVHSLITGCSLGSNVELTGCEGVSAIRV